MSEPVTRTAVRRPVASRLLLLNALFPGLGHLVAGRARWALVLAAPVLLLLGATIVVVLASSATSLGARLFDPAVLGALVALQIAILVWRLFALGATRMLGTFRATATTFVALAVSLLVVIGPQLYLAGLTVDAQAAAAQVFQPVAEGGAWVPDATPPPVETSRPGLRRSTPRRRPAHPPRPAPRPPRPRRCRGSTCS